MATIYTYPQKTTLSSDDLLLLSDSASTPTTNITKSATLGSLVSFIGGVSGSGTFNTIPLWTPDGETLGDSNINQDANGNITVGVNLTVVDNLSVQGDFEVENTITVNGGADSVFNGPVIFNDNISVNGDSVFEGEANFQSSVTDQASSPGTAGQVLTSTGTNVEWVDPTDVVSGSVATLIPFLTTASPGGSETYTALNNIVKIGWSGGNGTYVINLPSAATIPYRVIRFVTNGTYPGGGAHKVRFTPVAPETIDGAAFFEISKVYEGLSIWSTGTEWVVIQAKAH